MLLKWIRCEALNRNVFGHGQKVWAELRNVPGFLSQRGGWWHDTAHVIALWSGVDSHDLFHGTFHDELEAAQAGTYERADVRPDGADHFVRAQTEMWNPGMSTAPGFVGGVFGRHDNEFLVELEPDWEVL